MNQNIYRSFANTNRRVEKELLISLSNFQWENRFMKECCLDFIRPFHLNCCWRNFILKSSRPEGDRQDFYFDRSSKHNRIKCHLKDFVLLYEADMMSWQASPVDPSVSMTTSQKLWFPEFRLSRWRTAAGKPRGIFSIKYVPDMI